MTTSGRGDRMAHAASKSGFSAFSFPLTAAAARSLMKDGSGFQRCPRFVQRLGAARSAFPITSNQCVRKGCGTLSVAPKRKSTPPTHSGLRFEIRGERTISVAITLLVNREAHELWIFLPPRAPQRTRDSRCFAYHKLGEFLDF